MPIGFNETDYFVRMWNQAGGVMDIYAAETMANTVFEPLPTMKPIVVPGVGEAVAAEAMGTFAAMESEASSSTALRSLAAAADDTDGVLPDPNAIGVDQFSQMMQGLGQLGGPMQQLMQPLQQMMSSMSSGAGNMGGSTGLGGDLLGAGKLGDTAGKGAQLGMIGAPPLSSHPLTGGSGPSMGMGLMHSEALPGQGGTSPRTSMMSSLVEKPGRVESDPPAPGPDRRQPVAALRWARWARADNPPPGPDRGWQSRRCSPRSETKRSSMTSSSTRATTGDRPQLQTSRPLRPEDLPTFGEAGAHRK